MTCKANPVSSSVPLAKTKAWPDTSGTTSVATAINGAAPPIAVATLVVPDVSGQAFGFAKGTLEDTGFALQVIGSVHGYAANKGANQSPPAGTRVPDTR